MEQDKLNEVLQRNVAKLSKLSECERDMMPAGTAPMPSVEEVRMIVSLCKDIIFTDYFHKRQSDEKMRSYHIGVSMDELFNLLKRQIARGMQFCEEAVMNQPSAQPEIIHCGECIYYDPPHVEKEDARYEYSEMPKEAFDVLGTGLVSMEYGINIGGRCCVDY